jgi:hypothetical protein
MMMKIPSLMSPLLDADEKGSFWALRFFNPPEIL